MCFPSCIVTVGATITTSENCPHTQPICMNIFLQLAPQMLRRWASSTAIKHIWDTKSPPSFDNASNPFKSSHKQHIWLCCGLGLLPYIFTFQLCWLHGWYLHWWLILLAPSLSMIPILTMLVHCTLVRSYLNLTIWCSKYFIGQITSIQGLSINFAIGHSDGPFLIARTMSMYIDGNLVFPIPVASIANGWMPSSILQIPSIWKSWGS